MSDIIIAEDVANSDRISVVVGDLREGNNVEFGFDFSCDVLSNLYTNKRWTAYTEKDLAYDTYSGRYYYLDNKNIVQEDTGTDYSTVYNLKIGRLFVFFEFIDVIGQKHKFSKIVKVLPNVSVEIPKRINAEDYNQIAIKTAKLVNISGNSHFTDADEYISLSATQTNYSYINRTFPMAGMYTFSISADYGSAKYNDETSNLVIWESLPSDKFVGLAGPLGGAIRVQTPIIDINEYPYIVKLNLEKTGRLQLNIDYNINQPELTAPITITFNDKSIFYTMNGEKKRYYDIEGAIAAGTDLPIDADTPLIPNPDPNTAPTNPYVADPDYFLPINNIYLGDDSIYHTSIDFGDGGSLEGMTINFNVDHTYYKAGNYIGKYTLYTKHYLSANLKSVYTVVPDSITGAPCIPCIDNEFNITGAQDEYGNCISGAPCFNIMYPDYDNDLFLKV